MKNRALLLGLSLLCACVAGPGQPCGRSSACEEGGTCLKGVCSAYACESDADCGDLRCGQIAGVSVCVQDCEDDAACQGQQRCEAVDAGDSGGEASVCL